MSVRSSLTVLALAAGSVLFATSPVLAKDQASSIAPSSQWSVDYGVTKCRLARIFGEGDNRHLLFIEQSQPGRTFGLTVAGPEVKRFRSLRTTKMHFFDGQEPKRTEPFKGEIEGYGDAVIYSSISLEKGDESASEDDSEITTLPQLDPIFADQVEYVALRQSGRKVRLATGPLGEPFKVLNDCTQDMVRS
ncbi:MAG: hypothetical protein AAF250_06450 [Pseudomonadota bacterium]